MNKARNEGLIGDTTPTPPLKKKGFKPSRLRVFVRTNGGPEPKATEGNQVQDDDCSPLPQPATVTIESRKIIRNVMQ